MAFVPNTGLRVGDKYVLESCIGAGGMGTVWTARHVKLGARSAIKFMTVQADELTGTLARFEREARATALLKSPHVVRVHDYGVEDETPFMVMELLDGEDLAERLKRVRSLSLEDAKVLSTGVAKGLRVAHAAGIVHRDIKPRNIFYATEGGEEIVKLVDFGIARDTRRTPVDERTATGIVVGSPHHMSPEQATCGDVDARSDLWSLGVVLFHALTGARPFEGGSMSAILLAVVSAPLPRASSLGAGLSREVDAFFDKALCRDPKGRFQSADEMAAAFQALSASPASTEAAPAPVSPLSRNEATLAAPLPAAPLPASPLPAAPPEPTTPEPTEAPRPRLRLALGLVALLVLGTTSAALYAFRGTTAATPEPRPLASASPEPAATSTSSARLDEPPPAASQAPSASPASTSTGKPAARPAPKAPPKEAAGDHCKKRDPEYGVCLQW